MTEKNVKLLQVTSASRTDDITLSAASNPTDVFIKRTPVKLPPMSCTDGENGVVQSDSDENAWEDETGIIQSCLARRLHNSRTTLSNYPLNEEDNKLAKKKTIKLWNTVFHFLSNTSFHGLPHIVGSRRSQCRLTFWIIVILIALGFMLWAVVSVTIQYAAKNTVLFSKQYFNERLRFPAITICNKNLHRKSVARSTGIQEDVLLAFLNELTRGDSLFSGIFNSNHTDPQHASLANITSNTPTFYYNNSGHQISEMLTYCRYAMRNCSTDNFIQRTSTSGNCYTFNSGENGSAVLYSIEGGYRFGLEVILNAEQYEYFLPGSDSVGFNVFIHDQGQFPYIGSINSFFSVSTGQLTQVALHKVDYKLQTPSGGGQCDDSISLKYFTSYSRASCIAECITDLVVGACNCKNQGMPGPAQVCKLRDMCIGRVLSQGFDPEQCNCPVACETTVYEKTLSYARFPADHISILLNNSEILSTYPFPDFIVSTVTDDHGGKFHYLNDNFTESFLSKNFAKVFIYYEDLVSTSMEEGLEYSTFQFIADFGGHIGLFTGAGFLTLFEIIDLCYSMIRPIDD